MNDISWEGVTTNVVSTLLATLIIYAGSRLFPILWSRFSNRLRPWIWGFGFGLVTRFYVNAFISAIKRRSEIRSRIRVSRLRLFTAAASLALFLICSVFVVNLAIYLELVRDVSLLLQFAVDDSETAKAGIESMAGELANLHQLFKTLASPYAIFAVLAVVTPFMVVSAISDITQEFKASLEVELKRLNEYMKILASKQELKDLALLECDVQDASTGGAYVERINEIAERHGIVDFDRLFPIVGFLRRLNEYTVDPSS